MAGIVMKIKFKTPKNASQKKGKARGKFSAYVDYLDREESKNDNRPAGSVYSENKGSNGDGMSANSAYGNYTEYMGNKEKTTGLFTENKDVLTEKEKTELKKMYDRAESKGSVFWQPLFSFETEFLTEAGLYNPKRKVLNEAKLKEYTRAAVAELLKNEHLEDVTWAASIHYNTEHIHIHISIAENNPVWTAGKGRCMTNQNGKIYQRGKFKQKSIDRAKGKMASLMLDEKQVNIAINEIVRKKIIVKTGLGDFSFAKNSCAKGFTQLICKLPENKYLWKYNMNAMKDFRKEIDELTTLFINEYCKSDCAELLKILERQTELQSRAYGRKSNYSDNVINDLYARMGNAILREGRQFLRNKHREIKREMKAGHFSQGQIIAVIFRLKQLLEKDIESLKNLAIYERFMNDEQINIDV